MAGKSNKADVIIVLASFRAEGTPRMALDICRWWLSWGIRVVIVDLQRGTNDLQSEFEAFGLPILQCPVPHTGYTRYLRLAWDFWHCCRVVKPTSVLSMPSGLHAFMFLGAKLAGVERTVVHQGVYPFYWKSGFWKYKVEYWAGFPFTDRVVTCSRYVERGVREHFSCGNAKTLTIYNGIPLEKYKSLLNDGASRELEKPAVVLMVGRIDRTKDYGTLVDAAAVLSERGVKVELRFAGDGDQRLALERRVKEKGLERLVSFLGVCTDIPQQLMQAHLFAYSVNVEEGFGIALVEAMAAGVPAVASDVPGCREVLDDGDLGLLVSPGDPVAMADGIQQILDFPDAARQRAARARKKVLKEFSAETMARRYADILGLPAMPPTIEKARQ